ncbi:MAG TPA: TerB family tellurite resistance protein [Methylovirgula sp.]|nr:TerB family tellurite resistance protein [Methylovirgula sp.]
MFDRLKTFMAELAGTPAAREFGEDDYRLATVALLVHLAKADGPSDAPERRRLTEIIEKNFGLDPVETERLIQSAEASDKEAVDFYHFTRVLCRTFDQAGRLRIIEMMWEIAFADGVIHEVEENIVARIAELLGVSAHDRVTLRHRVAVQPVGTPFGGPWAAAVKE